MNRIMVSVEKAGQSLNMIMDKAGSSLDRAENTIGLLEGITIEKQKTIKEAIEDFRQAMENANIFFKKGVSLVDGTDDSISLLNRNLLSIAQTLETASENLNRLIELVADHPSQLIFGEAPIPRKVEQNSGEK